MDVDRKGICARWGKAFPSAPRIGNHGLPMQKAQQLHGSRVKMNVTWAAQQWYGQAKSTLSAHDEGGFSWNENLNEHDTCRVVQAKTCVSSTALLGPKVWKKGSLEFEIASTNVLVHPFFSFRVHFKPVTQCVMMT